MDVMHLTVVLPDTRRLQDTDSEVCSATLLAQNRWRFPN
jgi:hypothetical protein